MGGDMQLMPDMAELVWSLMSLLVLLGLIGGLVLAVVVISWRASGRDEALRRIEHRLDRLEQGGADGE